MLSEKKQELQVAALENGTVIDHIPSERLFTVVSLLGLEHMSNNITIGFNPKCITNNEPMPTLFHVVDKDNCVIKCHYCEKEQTREDIEIL